jgi:hypothetical protein
MKGMDTSFDDYIERNNKVSLHPNVSKMVAAQFPESIKDLHNIIFYGPKGIGKYTQVLSAIKKYSPSGLKYEKKISIAYNKGSYFFKISDIHFEIDMSLLGCNTKVLWNELFNHIVDVILAKPDKVGIIVCKYFHETHSELLDSFYSYMQQNTSTTGVQLIFVLVCEAISFIPDNIVKSCHIIHLSRPSKASYNKCLDIKLPKTIDTSNIVNMKHIENQDGQLYLPHKITCDKIITLILNVKSTRFVSLRDCLYDIFIYNLDVSECIWYMIERVIRDGHVKDAQVPDLLLRVYTFSRYYNNNYRPIYHLEGLVCYLINIIHGFHSGV